MTTRDHASTRNAIMRCLSVARFRNVVVFSDRAAFPWETIEMPKLDRWDQASGAGIILTMDHRHLYGDYVLGVHWDGFIVNPDAWDPEFLNYDYIGAPFYDNGIVGNNGFCICSRAWFDAVAALDLQPHECHPSDRVLCIERRPQMEALGIRYAPPDLARRFSVEFQEYQGSFGFHGTKTLTSIVRQGLIF